MESDNLSQGKSPASTVTNVYSLFTSWKQAEFASYNAPLMSNFALAPIVHPSARDGPGILA